MSTTKEYHLKNGYKVTVVSNSEIQDVVTPQLRNGEGPDIVYLGTNSPSGFAQNLILSGSILNISELLEETVLGEDVLLKDKILPGFLDTTSTMPYADPGVVSVFENLSALQPYFAWDLYDSAKPIDNEAQILNNDVLFVPSGSWMPSELEEYAKAEGFEYGYMAPPALEVDGDRYSAGMMEQIYALNTGDEAKEEASKEFLKYLYSDEAVEIIIRNQGGMVPTVNSLEIATEAGIDDLTLELYWKQTYCFSMDSVMQGIDGADAQWWLSRMQQDAATLKEGIQSAN